jgi:atypical dual specificity phosphatase
MLEPDLSAEQRRSHSEVYATLSLLAFEWNWLDDRIAAGRNPLTAVDVAELAQAGITHILDLREEKEWSAPRPGSEAIEFCRECGIVRLHLPLTNLEAPREEDILKALDWLETTLQNPQHKIYVHCQAGKERTGTIAVAFHARRTGQSYDAAFQELKQKRDVFQPWPHQEAAVRAWLQASAESTT